MRLNPRPGDTISIDGVEYQFVGYEGANVALDMAYSSEGTKGIVYRLRDRHGTDHALKVFKEKYRLREIKTVNDALKAYSAIPGMRVLDRDTLCRPIYRQVLDQYPELEFAVRMPWIAGQNWQNYWLGAFDDPIDQKLSIELVRTFAETMWNLEQAQIAHCDLAGSNIMIDVRSRQVQVIDVEDSYVPGLQPPSACPAGTSGYQHSTSRSNPRGQWCPAGDRFAFGLLVAELLAWPYKEIRQEAGAQAESYFTDDDLQQPTLANPRYRLMFDVLTHISPDAGRLFAHNWQAATLEKCVSIEEWHGVLTRLTLPRAQPTIVPTDAARSQQAGTGWRPIGQPQAVPTAPKLIPVGTRRGASPPPEPVTADFLTRAVATVLPPPFEWCEIPAGRVTLEVSAGTFDVQPFFMAKYPITFEQFQVFIDDPQGWKNDEWWQGLAADASHRRAPGKQRFTHAKNLPRENVSWYDAVAFCRWLTARLSLRERGRG